MNDRRDFIKKAAAFFAGTTLTHLIGARNVEPSVCNSNDHSIMAPRKGIMTRYAKRVVDGEVQVAIKPYVPLAPLELIKLD